MAKRASRRAAAASALVTGRVATIGRRPKITVGQRTAPVADLRITVTGGTPGSRVTATFTVTLNIKLARTGTTTLIDETGASRAVSAVRAGASYIFEDIRFPAPVSAPRTIRITNVRVNVAMLGGSSAMIPAQIIAMVSMSGSTPFRLTGAQQTVAAVVRA